MTQGQKKLLLVLTRAFVNCGHKVQEDGKISLDKLPAGLMGFIAFPKNATGEDVGQPECSEVLQVTSTIYTK